MSKQIKLNSRIRILLFKVSACAFGLLLGFFILAPHASMQDEEVIMTTNSNMRMMSNYKPTPEPPKSTIRGHVIYADTGRAVRRAGLMLLSATGRGRGTDNTGLTNEQGEFEIKNVAEGKYFVSVSTPGVLTPFSSVSNIDRIMSQDKSAMADVAKDFQEVFVNGITDTEVTIAVKRGAAISGRIMYADGEAAIGLRVEVLRKKDGQYNAVVSNIGDVFGAMFGAAGGLKTDDRGVFRIAGLPAGDYIVRAVENVSHSEQENNRGDSELMAMSGINPSSMVATYFPGTDDEKKAETFKVEAGQEQSEVNITIPERTYHNLGGTVISKATRQPLKSARVSLKRVSAVNSMFSSMRGVDSGDETDEQGRWKYKELPTGKYILTVQPPYDYESREEKNQQKEKKPKLAPYQKEIVIDEKDTTDLTLEIGVGSIVSGTISVENQQNLPSKLSVSITEAEGKSFGNDYIGESYENGSTNQAKAAPKKTDDFKIEGLSAGKFYLTVSASNLRENEKTEESYVKSIILGGKDITNSMFETKEGEELKGIQIILSKDVGKIKGKISNSEKNPVSGAKIYFISTDNQKRMNFASTLSAVSSGEGEFEVSGAPGEYFVIFPKEVNIDEQEGQSLVEKRRAWLEKETKNAQKVTIKAKEIEKVTLILPEN